MPPTPSPSHDLRARARALRGLATALGSCAALGLHRRAGGEVWQGPLANACRDDLLAMRRRLLATHDDLLHAARRLERLAEEAEAVMRR